MFWEAAFVAINVAQLSLIVFWNRVARFSEEERDFHLAAVPELEPAQARQLLRIGREVEPGVTLILEDKPVDELIYVLSGSVDISLRA